MLLLYYYYSMYQFQECPLRRSKPVRTGRPASRSLGALLWPAEYHGIIVGYHVFCISENPPRHKNVTTHNNRTLEVTVVGLLSGQQYGVKVAAYTIAGMGPFSDIVYVTLPKGENSLLAFPVL